MIREIDNGNWLMEEAERLSLTWHRDTGFAIHFAEGDETLTGGLEPSDSLTDCLEMLHNMEPEEGLTAKEIKAFLAWHTLDEDAHGRNAESVRRFHVPGQL